MARRHTIEHSTNNDSRSKEMLAARKNAAIKLLAVASLASTPLFLAACAEGAPEVKPLPTEYSVGDVMLDVDLAESRHSVLELCNTGEGADEMRQEWADFGYEEKSGKTWIEALTFTADYAYDNDQAIIDDGSYTYPTIEALAENCQEAALLASKPAAEARYPETAMQILEEYREKSDEYVDSAPILQSIYNANTQTITEATE